MSATQLVKPRTFGIGHDDMLGEVRSSIAGATTSQMHQIGSANELSD